MKIVEINSGNHGSVGNVIEGIAECAKKNGHIVYLFCPPGRTQRKDVIGNIFIGTILERRLSDLLNSITGFQGALNWFGTKKLLKILDEIEPDIIHLHNLHTNYINIRMLFHYLQKKNIKIVWTFHDCWPFTGHCPHFENADCNKWKTECKDCKMYKEYPATLFDQSKKMFTLKKNLFTNIEDMIVVTPSIWLKKIVEQSFFKQYPVKVINNGIDIKKFTPRKSYFREKYNLQNKFIILCVAFFWGISKGEDRIERLAETLDERFQIVLVGKEQKDMNNKKIICIPRTNNQEELAEIYTASDVLFNPTRADNFPTVNIEALACGTPVLSYGAGGSAEAFDSETGMIVNDDNIVEKLEKLYIKNFSEKKCRERSLLYNKENKFQEYITLFEHFNEYGMEE